MHKKELTSNQRPNGVGLVQYSIDINIVTEIE